MSADVLRDRVSGLIEHFGGVRAAARELDIDPAYLVRLRSGEKGAPSDETLEKLGLRKIVETRYVRIRT